MKLTRIHSRTLLAIAASSTIAACGGGGTAETPPVFVTATTGPAVTADAKTGISIQGTANTSRYALTALNWIVQPANPTSDAIVSTNADCAAAQKTETPSLNNGGQAITSSNWSCALGLKLAGAKADTTYNVTLTAKDTNGNVTSSTTSVLVKAETTPANGPVTVTAGAPQDVVTGATVPLSCFADGGRPAAAGYTWQWVQSSAPDLPITLASTTSRVTSFVAPAVAVPTTVTLDCRATDDAAITGIGTKTIRVLPAVPNAQPILLANAGKASTAAPGATVTLDGAATGYFDSQGQATAGPFIYYQWVQTSGSTLAIANATAKAASFTVPVDVSARTIYEFQLHASPAPLIPGALTDSTATVRVTADPASTLGLTLLNPSLAVAKGANVSLWGLTKAPTGTTVYFSWTQISGPAIALGAATTANAGFVVPPTATIGTAYVMRVSASFSPITVANPGIASQDMVITVTQ